MTANIRVLCVGLILLFGCNTPVSLPQPQDPDCGMGWSEADAGCLDVDECEEGLDDCAEAAECTNIEGGFECVCQEGFEGDGKTCVDIDECGLRLDNCADDARCENTPGGFECVCETGFDGNGISCTDVDECAAGTHDCGPFARCDNTPGTFECVCLDGFRGDGRDCQDIDECTLRLDNCSDAALCDNQPGTFECTCREGYEGDGVVCADIDECTLLSDNCHPDAVCLNTPGAFECLCPSGFEGDGRLCDDVDECALGTHTCPATATCTNTWGGYDCLCNAGFDGDGERCEDVDECALGTDNCHPNATCRDIWGGFECACDPGYVGDGVVCADVDECAAERDTCAARAQCVNTPGGFECRCEPGFEGDGQVCVDIDECETGVAECAADARCANRPGGYDCACEPGFEGDGRVCTNIDECATGADNCDNAANCVDTQGGFQCVCQGGYVGDGVVCTDVDECAADTDDCDPNAACINTPGGFTCNCNPGWTADGLECVDIDECATAVDNCSDNAECTNTPGGFTCGCLPGFVGDGVVCSDVDECAAGGDNNCGANAACTNTPGSFTCACNVGFTGDGIACADVDECTDGIDNCSDNAGCTNTPGGFECACTAGFAGDGVECADIDECLAEADNCAPNATCTNTPGGFTCACPSGWTGDGVACVEIDECAEGVDNCSDNAICTNTDGSFTCECALGFAGDGVNCTDIDECARAEDNCAENATCTNTPGAFTCACDPGWVGNGLNCQGANPCAAGTDNCSEDATCTNTRDGFTCTCRDGFVGDGVECADVDECAADPNLCGANATCVNTDGSFDCACDAGWIGDGIDCTDVDECADGVDNCSDDATCVNTLGDFTCTCIDGFEGNGVVCTDVDECQAQVDDCGDNATCTNTVGGFECACNVGWIGDGTVCADEDECVAGTDNCSDDALCSNTQGGFECACNAGFEGNGVDCAEIDECQIANGGCEQICINEIGTFRCECEDGFTLNADVGTCTDINECDDNPCGADVVCVNLPGSYECQCDPGYEHFLDRCMEVDECLMGRHDCAEGAHCTNTVGSFECECLPGFVGDGKQCQDIDECADGLDDCRAPAVCRNTAGAFQCDCPDGLIAHAGGCIPPAVCDAPTDWDQIAPSLADYAAREMLPSVPAAPLPVAWDDPSFFREDMLQPDPNAERGLLTPERCDGPNTWPADRVQVGPVGETEDHPFNQWQAGNPYCRVQFDARESGGGSFEFMHRGGGSYGMLNTVPLSGEPNWARLRFPIPPGHRATQFTYTLKRASLVGSHPEHCADGQVPCARQYLADDEAWDDVVPPGLFLLWARPGDCNGWLITGPHSPGIRFPETAYTIEVPAPLQDAEELVVSLLVYHQYPGCDGPPCAEGDDDCEQNCASETHTHSSVELMKAGLRTEGTLDLDVDIPADRPRLFGDDAQWLAENALFDDMACVGGDPQWGGVPDMRGIWSQRTLGANVCNGEDPPASIDDHPYAGMYRDGTLDEARYRGRGWNWGGPSGHRTIGLITMHMLRRELACHRAAAGDCQFTLEDVNAFVDDFIDLELSRFGLWVWHGYGEGFDINSAGGFIFWTTFVDVLGHRLTDEQLALVSRPMSVGIDNYLRLYRERHWHIFNGNNWTATLSRAALHWAITHWHEDDRAPTVADIAIKTLWLHRDFYLSDGVYVEGTNYVSFNSTNLQILDRLVWQTFGVHLESIRWPYLANTGEWLIEQMLPDGRKVDFADAWPKGGFTSIEPLTLLLATEMVGGDPVDLDPCLVRRFFINYAFEGGLEIPWTVPPIMATRDWHALVATCGENAGAVPEVKTWPEGGYGLIRSRQAGATQVGQRPPDGGRTLGRYEQSDDTVVVVSALPNGTPHTELDFASIIWAAYGQRLLTDMGYGTIGSSGASVGGGHHRYDTLPDHAPDNNPTGHNTLVVREAVHPDADNPASTNVSQINGERGTVERRVLDGTAFVEVDGSDVYGAQEHVPGGRIGFDRDDYVPPRWLQGFKRAIIPIPGGDFILADMFRVRDDQGQATVEEYWHVRQMADPPAVEACRANFIHVDLDPVAPDTIRLRPRCSALLVGDGNPAESVGQIIGAGMRPGQFVVADEQISFTNRVNGTDVFRRARWVPDDAASDGIRVFLLSAAPSDDGLPANTSVTPRACGEDQCFDVRVDDDLYTLTFEDGPKNWSLTALLGWP